MWGDRGSAVEKRLRAAAPASASSSLSWGFLSHDRARLESKCRSFILTQGSKYDWGWAAQVKADCLPQGFNSSRVGLADKQ